MTTNRPKGSDFIGRQREMAVLTAALSDALAGRGRLVMLAGEPGIGKTRLAQELARKAQESGVRVLWGWCYEGDGAPSYWPWVDSLRDYVQRTEPGLLRKQLGSGAAPMGEMIPEVLAILDGVGMAPMMEPDQARFRLFDAITGFLKRASEDSPILLVLDDLHWADQPSLLLLEFLARQLDGNRILITGTYRDTEAPSGSPLGESLARLARLASFQRQPIMGLPSEDVGAFVLGETGIRPPDPILSAIHAHTEGNPFFLGEVVRYLAERGRLDEAWDASAGYENLGIPQSIRDVIGQRLTRLTEPCNQALTTASVIGREFDFNLLGTLTEPASPEELLDLMDEAISARIIEDLPGGALRYQFRHALMQQTLTENISTGQKARLHARIGEALETAYGDRLGERAAELAHHFTQAVPVLGSGKMLRYTLLAGERALATYAHEEALTHFQRGLTAKGVPLESSEAAEDAIAAELLYGLGRAQSAASGITVSKMSEAIGNRKKAFEYFRQAGNRERALQVAEYPARPRSGYQTGLQSLVGPAVELAPPDSAEAARLYSIYGSVLGLEAGSYDEAQEAFNRALAIAEDIGDLSLEMAALAGAANVHLFHARLQAALRTSLRAIELSAQVNDPKSEMAARYVAVSALLATGNLQDATRNATAMLVLAERVRDNFWLLNAYWVSENVSARKGDWQASRSFSDRGLSVSPAAATLLFTRVKLEYLTGHFDEGALFLERLLERASDVPDLPVFEHAAVAALIPEIARITGLPERFDVAEKAAETVLSSPKALPRFSSIAEVGLALMAVTQGDKAACEKLYDRFLSRGEFPTVVFMEGSLLGLLAQALGKFDRAMDHFEDALSFCRKAGFRPELARTCCDYAVASLKRDGAGDREKAISLLDESLAISTELGMRPLLERVIALQEQAEAQPVSAPVYPDGLTQREVEVLRLVATGKTDREIAGELFISAATVSTHVRNLLNKTGVANRTEAASYANQHGLVTPLSEDDG